MLEYFKREFHLTVTEDLKGWNNYEVHQLLERDCT
jgi:hypothetical protein